MDKTDTDKTEPSGRPDIFALGGRIDAQLAEQWQRVLDTYRAKLTDAYARAGDAAFGTYLNLLFRNVKRDLREAGLRTTPPLPGDFGSSREWGNADGTDNERWMWSAVHTASGEPLGTLVTTIPHDHSRFRLPRRPHVFALRETERSAVEAALCTRSDDFAGVQPFNEWYEGYLRQEEARR